MKNILSKLNKAFESRIRLGINTMKQLMELTDGNLASHLKALETLGYIQSVKQFIGRKPNTQYSITEEGRKSFKEHLNALEELIK